MGNLLTIRIPDHVVVKHDCAHSRELHTPALQRTATSLWKGLGANADLSFDLFLTAIIKSTVRPMTMRAQDTGRLTLALGRSIQTAGDIEPGHTLKINPFNRVVPKIHFAVHHRIQRRRLGHRPQSRRNQQLAFDKGPSCLPCLQR